MNAKNIICLSIFIAVLIALLIFAILPHDRDGADGVTDALGRAGGVAEEGLAASREAGSGIDSSIGVAGEVSKSIDTSIRESQAATGRIEECQKITGDIGAEIPGDIERIERCRDIIRGLQEVTEDR